MQNANSNHVGPFQAKKKIEINGRIGNKELS
jgi:hypothetical protein